MNREARSVRYLLSVEPRGAHAQKRVWNGHSTLALGHPYRWVLEKTSDGVRLRSLRAPLNQAYGDSVREFTAQELARSCEATLDGAKIKISPIQELPAAFSQASVGNGPLNVYFCLSNCVISTQSLAISYRGKVQGKKVFNLHQTGSSVKLTSHIDGLEVLSQKHGNHKIAKGSSHTFETGQLAESSLHWNAFYWFVRPVNAPAISKSKDRILLDDETRFYRKSLMATGVALALLLMTTFLVPKPDPKKEEELIPAKIAKLVLTQPKSTAAAPAASKATPTENKEAEAAAPKKVAKAKDTAVVQAFRAKALQNAVSGLLRGGMTNLLAQSEMLMGADSSKAARRMLDGKSVAGLPTAPVTGLTGARSVDVASIGGNGDPKSVGYGKGQKAAVSGQGKSFVGLDLEGSSVEEGLTKDEVGKVIHAHMSEIRYCYESSMVRNPDVEGKLMLDFTIGANGFVTVANVRESSLKDARLDDCVIRRLTKWAFPKPKGGVNVAVSYPFIFKTLGR